MIAPCFATTLNAAIIFIDVIPAQAGIQGRKPAPLWMPAFAGMTAFGDRFKAPQQNTRTGTAETYAA